MPPEQKQSFMNRQLSVRGIGLLALLGGTLVAYLSVVSPLLAASRHEESVMTTLKGTGITPLILALGVVYTFFPAKATALLGHPQKPTRLGWVFALVFGLLGIPLYLWLKSRLREYGYAV
jgi:threonine/homoserine/homoserine lactone efflux protein